MPLDDLGLQNEPVSFKKQDIFLGLNLALEMEEAAWQSVRELRLRGIIVYFVVYDLLPGLLPQRFPSYMKGLYERWLQSAASASGGLICISNSVLDELHDWLNDHRPERDEPLPLDYFHLGADIDDEKSEEGGYPKGFGVPAEILDRPAFLMVGTVEPRKGHRQVLDALKMLWNEKVDIGLVVVGKPGWQETPLFAEMRKLSKSGNRFIWIEAADDNVLNMLYRKSTALIMAAEGEGFGLPIIEAAKHGLDIIARDLPVFHEIAGSHAYYFSGFEPERLARSLKEWLALKEKDRAPAVNGMTWLRWQDSAERLIHILLQKEWMRTWEPNTSTGSMSVPTRGAGAYVKWTKCRS
jgi:glycosyltransferase involved in cell wall biosynthesis